MTDHQPDKSGCSCGFWPCRHHPADEHHQPKQEDLQAFDKADYQRLKKLEIQGFEDYQKMRDAPALTPERVVAFINQLSPWNLKTTGISLLEAYADNRLTEAIRRLPEKKKYIPNGTTEFNLTKETEKSGYNAALYQVQAILNSLREGEES